MKSPKYVVDSDNYLFVAENQHAEQATQFYQLLDLR